jgi:hypothetical protein
MNKLMSALIAIAFAGTTLSAIAADPPATESKAPAAVTKHDTKKKDATASTAKPAKKHKKHSAKKHDAAPADAKPADVAPKK